VSVSSTFLERWRAERAEQRRREQVVAQQLDRIRQEREQERQRRSRSEALRGQVREDLLARKQQEQQQQSRKGEQQSALRALILQARRDEQRQQTERTQQQKALRMVAAQQAQERAPRPETRAPEPVRKPKPVVKQASRTNRSLPQPSHRHRIEDLTQAAKQPRPRAQKSAAGACRLTEVQRQAKPTRTGKVTPTLRSEESARQRRQMARAKELERRAEFRLSRPELPTPPFTQTAIKHCLVRPLSRQSSAMRAAVSRGATAPGLQLEEPTLSWLSAQGGFLVDENGNAVYLRGVNVTGLDTVTPGVNQTLAEALTLDQSSLTTLTDGWGVNLIRVPFTADSILSGTTTLPASVLLEGLDDLIVQAEGAGCYVLLALQPAQEADHILPSDNDYLCMQSLAIRYRDQPAVLYEPFASQSLLANNWRGIALAVIGTIRRQHPASLLFLGNGKGAADVSRLPLTFATGDPIYNMVYTIRLTPQDMNTVDRLSLQALSRNYPVFVSHWSDSGPDFGRSSELAADLIERYAAGWAAANWNADPRLVHNTSAHQYSATRWGLLVQRTLAQPVKPLLRSYLGRGELVQT
jgi:hypothetical protein